jgi:hypothetical protein
MSSSGHAPLPSCELSPRDYAVLFDLDGVLTKTASVHAAAWKKLLDEFLEKHSADTGEPFVPFDIDADYRRYVDGKPRYDGVTTFLKARGIELPQWAQEDGPGVQSVRALDNLKDKYFQDVGFAIGAGTDVAMESADVVLMKSDPYDIVGAIELSRATLRKMHQNLWWAVGYDAIAFPLAAGVLYLFTLSPEIAALSMSGSSAIVAINALLLKRTKLAGIKSPSQHSSGAGAKPAATGAPA